MDYRSAYIRRSRKGSRLKKRLAAVGLLGVAACAALFALEARETASPLAARTEAAAPVAAATPAPAVLRTAAQVETKKTRRVYPYSIVPGGVLNRQELTHAVVVDKVVAEHYAAFEAGKAAVRTVDKPRGVYVSYRKGEKVFWTSKKLQLAQGETLLSDGQNEIRTRCGNRISDVPQLPVEANGPSEEELDSSVEQAQEDEGTVEQVGYAADTNPAGHGYQLQTFGSGETAPAGGTAPTRTSFGFGVNGIRSSGLGPIWDGGTLPATLAQVSSDIGGTGTDGGPGTGTPGSGGTTIGTDAGGSGGGGDPGKTGSSTPGGTSSPDGTTPGGSTPGTGTPTGTDPGTKPSTPPGTLLPPTDQPGQTNDPGKTPVKPHGDVPEPGTLWLAGAGVAALLASRRAKKRPRG